MKKTYLAFDASNFEFEEFLTLKEAQDWIKEVSQDTSDGSLLEETENCKIYILHETVKLRVTDKKSNYEYEDEDDIPEGVIAEAWPYSNSYDEVCEIVFVPVSKPVSRIRRLLNKYILNG